MISCLTDAFYVATSINHVPVVHVIVSAYKKSYSSNYVLLKLLEEWKKSLDDKNIIRAVLMDLSIAFDCPPQFTCCKTSCLLSFYGCNNIYFFVYKKKTGNENKWHWKFV